MKKEIPKPIAAAIAAVALVAVAAALYFTTRTPELPGAKKLPNYSNEIPAYIKDAQAGRPPVGSQIGDLSQLPPEKREEIQRRLNENQ